MRHTTSNSPKNLLKCYRHLLIAVIGWVIWMVIFFWTKKAIAPRYFIHCSLDDKMYGNRNVKAARAKVHVSSPHMEVSDG